MWNGIGWYGFIGVITTSMTDISLIVDLYADFEKKVTVPCLSFRISVFVDKTHARGL